MRRWFLSACRGAIGLCRLHAWPLLRRGCQRGASVQGWELLICDKPHQCFRVFSLPCWIRMRHGRHAADRLQPWESCAIVCVSAMHAVRCWLVSRQLESYIL